jgi:hypothetical protein
VGGPIARRPGRSDGAAWLDLLGSIVAGVGRAPPQVTSREGMKPMNKHPMPPPSSTAPLRTIRVFTDGEKGGLRHQQFRGLELDRVDFGGADLCRARFDRVSLRGADFRAARLEGAQFVRCDLRGAAFQEALLDGVSFCACMLEGVTGLGHVGIGRPALALSHQP